MERGNRRETTAAIRANMKLGIPLLLAVMAPTGCTQKPADKAVPVQPAVIPRAERPESIIADPIEKMLPPMTFQEALLVDVIAAVADASACKINVDWPALEAAGISKNTRISLELRNKKFSRAMRLILDAANPGKGLVDFDENGDVVVVSTKIALIREKRYDIRFEFEGKLTRQARTQDAAELVKLITEMIDPASWGTDGRTCTVDVETDVLIVNQSPEARRQTERVVEQLRDTIRR